MIDPCWYTYHKAEVPGCFRHPKKKKKRVRIIKALLTSGFIRGETAANVCYELKSLCVQAQQDQLHADISSCSGSDGEAVPTDAKSWEGAEIRGSDNK